MKNYKVTVNGKTYEVGVEECGGNAEEKSVLASPVSRIPSAAAPIPKAAAAHKTAAGPSGSGTVTAPMPGTVLSVAVSEGEQVKKGQLLLIFEAMKMENELVAPCSGTVKTVNISKGTALETGMLLISIV